MKMPTTLISTKHQRGGTLLEVLIAILIFSFGILGLIGLQANLTRSASDSKYRAEAGFVAQQQLSRLWIAEPSKRNGMEKEDEAVSTLPNGKMTTKVDTANCNGNIGCAGQATITVSWTQPDGEPHSVTIVSFLTGV